jgi:hypothetical protein
MKHLWHVGLLEMKRKGMNPLNSLEVVVGDLQSVEVLDNPRWNMVLKNLLMELIGKFFTSTLDLM